MVQISGRTTNNRYQKIKLPVRTPPEEVIFLAGPSRRFDRYSGFLSWFKDARMFFFHVGVGPAGLSLQSFTPLRSVNGFSFYPCPDHPKIKVTYG